MNKHVLACVVEGSHGIGDIHAALSKLVLEVTNVSVTSIHLDKYLVLFTYIHNERLEFVSYIGTEVTFKVSSISLKSTLIPSRKPSSRDYGFD